jgi:hydroxyacylglutathione hydrolase
MKLTDKIHLLKINFEITLSPEKKLPRFVNVILIFGNKITLIDTGVKGSERAIFDYIKQNKRDFSEIDKIILSHSHPDHIGSAAKIKELTNCKIFAHNSEKEWIENIEIQNKQRPVPGFFDLVDKSVNIDENLSNGDEMVIEKDLTLKFIHSPGHSKGSLNIIFKEANILFTADSIPLKNDIPNYDNYPELLNSLKEIRANQAYKILLTSWTPALTSKEDINTLILEGEEYMLRINASVKENYKSENLETLGNCKATIVELGLPVFLVNPLVDKAFRSHFS